MSGVNEDLQPFILEFKKMSFFLSCGRLPTILHRGQLRPSACYFRVKNAISVDADGGLQYYNWGNDDLQPVILGLKNVIFVAVDGCLQYYTRGK
jgi:hypothetical protein